MRYFYDPCHVDDISNNDVSLSVKVTLVVEDKRPALTTRHTGQDKAEAVSHLWEKLGIRPFHKNQILEIQILGPGANRNGRQKLHFP